MLVVESYLSKALSDFSSKHSVALSYIGVFVRYVCFLLLIFSRSFIGSSAGPVITTLHWHSLDVRCLAFSTEGD